MVSGRYIIAIAVLAMLIAACQPMDSVNNMTNDSTDDFINDTTQDMEGPIVVDKGKGLSELDYDVVITGVEGEVIPLNPEAVDPDGDAVSYEFSEPFNDEGEWQTEIGDAGDYPVTVRAFDGVAYTDTEILVRVYKKNLPPVMNCPDRITVFETEKVNINCKPVDPEGDEVVVIYRGWMTTSTKMTTFEDQGTHTVYVTAWDKQNVDEKVEDSVIVEVKDLNRPPRVTLDFGTTINAMEGDVVTVKPTVNDPDNDPIDIEYSEPFNSKGVWKTDIGDAGTYDASLVVDDGENLVKKVFKVNIAQRNTAPVLERIQDIYVDEGEVINLPIETYDREDENVFVEVSGFMNSETYQTTYEDAMPNGCDEKFCTATYTVTVTVSDGELQTSQDVEVHIKDVNRPPVFKVPA